MMLKWLHNAIWRSELFSAANIMLLRVAMLAGKFVLALFIMKYIGLEALGVYGLISGTSAIIQISMRLGVFSNLSRIAVTQSLEDLTKNLRNYGIGIGFLYLIVLPVAIAIGIYFGKTNLIILAFFVTIFEHISIDIFALTNNLHRPKLANILLSIQSAGWIYVYIALAYFYAPIRSLDWVLLFWTMGGITTCVIAAFISSHWPWKEAFSSPLSLSWYKVNIRQSGRIYISDLINTITIYCDRYLITFFLNLELVGIYVLFWQVINAICNLVGAGVLQVYRPRLIVTHNTGDHRKFKELFWESARRTIGLTVLLAIASALIVPYLIRFTSQTMAMEYLPLLWLLLVALLFRIGSDICSYTLYAQHRDDLVLHSGVLKLLLAIISSTVLLSAIGIYGMVFSMAITGAGAILYAAHNWKEKTA